MSARFLRESEKEGALRFQARLTDMRHNDPYNPYTYRGGRGSKKKGPSQRTILSVLMVFICIICFVTIAILVQDILARKSSPASSTTAGTITLNSSAPGVSDTVASDSAAATDPAQTTPAASAAPSADRTAALTALQVAVSDYLAGQSGRYSVYYVNLKNGETLGYKETDPMVAASSIKIAYNTYLYQKAASGEASMDEWMTYNAKPYPDGDLETGTGTIQSSADGTKYQLKTLSNLSITISDNCATNMILRYLGGIDAVNDSYLVPISAIVNYRQPVSYTDYSGASQSGRQRTSAEDLALYAKNLYDLYKAAPDIYQQLVTDLETTEYNWGIPAGVPSQYKVAHKVGFNPSYGSNNDVGIVFGAEDYVLCVMTESANGSAAQAAIGHVSQLVSDYVTAQNA